MRPIELRSADLVVRTPDQATGDVECLRRWYSTPRLARQLNMPAQTLTHSAIQQHLAGFDNERAFQFILAHAKTGAAFGFASVMVDPRQKSAIWHFAVPDRREGTRRNVYGSVILILDWLFSVRGMDKLVTRIDARRRPLAATLERVGFVLEGTLRQEIRDPNGQRFDQAYYGVLANEWPSVMRRMTDGIGAPA